MLRAWHYGWFVAAVVCLSARLSFADEVLSLHEHELRAALAQDVIDPHQVLRALLGESGRFHSGDHEPDGFSVEILGFDDQGEEVRLIGDYSESGFRSLEHQGKTWRAFRHNKHCMKHEKGFPIIDEGSVQVKWSDLVKRSDSSSSQIDVSIAGMVSDRKDWVSAGYDCGLSEFRATASNGDLLVVHLRSPHDAVKFGSLISHASLWKDGQRTRELRRPARGHSPQRLPAFGRAELEALGDQIPKSDSAINQWIRTESPTHKLIYRVRGQHVETLMMLGGYTRRKGGKPISAPTSDQLKVEDLILNPLIGFAPAVVRCVPGSPIHPTSSWAVTPIQEDAAARWWDMELAITLSHGGEFVSNSQSLLTGRSDAPLKHRVMLAFGLATLGRPARLHIPEVQGEDQEILNAVLTTGREFPWRANQLDAMEAAANTANQEFLSFVAVDALVHANQFDRIPKSELSSWWNRYIVSDRVSAALNLLDNIYSDQPDAMAFHFQAERIRWPSIWKLSRYPASRRFLMSRIDSEAPRPIQELVLSALRMRARSALDQQRFDFMPRAECVEILAIPDFEVGGRDSEAGPARPFPTDP